MGAMDWLNGILGPTAQFGGQPQPYGQQPMGGAPYGQQPMGGAPYGQPPMGGPPMGGAPAPYAPGAPPAAAIPSWAQPSGAAPTPAMGPAFGGAGPSVDHGAPDPRIAALEARNVELQRDVDSIALFARTLLTVMLERQILTPEHFQETKNKIDMLDGKLDDRVAKGQ